MSVAFVFPGQGSQQVGMGRALRDAFPESRAVMEEADATLGFALSELCFQGPEGELQLTANTQPAILAASVAALRPLVARGVRPAWVAGHSLGEYSALVAAGTLSLADALRTVRRRGQYMQEAVPVGAGAMAAILGLDLPSIEAACRDAAEGEVVSPANVNSPGQVVIAGHAAAVDRASELCRARGAKRAVRLPVSAPFHCALMKPAQERLRPELAALAFRDPAVPLVNNVDARAVRDASSCRDGLVRQVSGAVRWQESVELLAREGVTTFVEVGPGKVLSGLVKKIAQDARVLNVDSPESLEGTVAALGAGAEG
jgi:[acyl-carrier-protein] S-malonyltransferase